MQKQDQQSNNQEPLFPPVISVLGHVDHGKTTLLDALRKTDLARKETGGITQKIGASQIEVVHDEKKRHITFIDTPGHEAFSNMRSYGVSASDLALLVVAADDGVMPQTKDSLDVLRKANLPFIVVLTKKDSKSANVEKVKQQLLASGVLLEGLGGEVSYIAVSAKTNDGIKDLIDLILLSYDLASIKKDEKADFIGVVIESKLEKKKGFLTTIVVRQGVVQVGDRLFQDKEIGKVKSLITPHNEQVKQAKPGDAVAILGVNGIVATGGLVFNKQQKTEQAVFLPATQPDIKTNSLSFLFGDNKKDIVLKLVLKTESNAEYEAIRNALPAGAKIIFQGQGDIIFSDIMLAKDMTAMVIGFNVLIERDAKTLADTEHVFYKTYPIIYELLDEIKDVLDLEKKKAEEVILGKGSILALFESEEKTILGIRVSEGRLKLGDTVKLTRGPKELGKSTISSLRRGKQEVKEIGRGNECGVILSPTVDIQIGDVLLSYNIGGSRN